VQHELAVAGLLLPGHARRLTALVASAACAVRSTAAGVPPRGDSAGAPSADAAGGGAALSPADDSSDGRRRVLLTAAYTAQASSLSLADPLAVRLRDGSAAALAAITAVAVTPATASSSSGAVELRYDAH
jgi:hypothetical protein